MTIKSRAVGAVLTLLVSSAASLLAQESGVPGVVNEAVPPPPAAGGDEGPLVVVAQFFSLSADQVQALAQALSERQVTLAPILQQIAQREQRIRELIASGGDPAEIGRLVVEIHQLRGQAEAAQARFVARFQSLLNDEQRGRWQQIRVAAALQPVLPAFQALQIL